MSTNGQQFRPPTWRDWAQLVRLPALGTAWADVGVGLAVASAATNAAVVPMAVVLLALATTLFYSAGMILNDVFDLEEDRRDRPHRPLPAGRIRVRLAAATGASLAFAGWGLAVLAGWLADSSAAWIGLLLALAIVGYDAGLKRTLLGPWVMASCRFMNVLLASSCTSAPIGAPHLATAGVVGLYILGVTWFARDEAGRSRRSTLALGLGCMAAAWLSLGILPLLFPREINDAEKLVFLLGGLGFLIWLAIPLRQAWIEPEAGPVQAGVKRSLLGLIVLDSLLAFVWVGWPGLLVLLLLPPALLLGRWLYAT
ncbi:MAG TPA: UbiA family prenyltransferase [Gemmatales bacterium]|nr:UbiA family prenyltransferase [Gemmatales bacterium]